MTRDGMTAALNAVSNASRERVSEADLLSMLKTGDGPGHLVRALFDDCSFETLDRLATTVGLSRGGLRAAYDCAKGLHGVANGDFESVYSVD